MQLAIERFLERPPAEAPPERTKSSPKPPAAPPPESSSEDEGDGAGIARNWNPPWDHRKEPDFVSRQASADAAAKVLFPLSESMGRKCEQWKELEQMYSTHAAFRADCQDDLEYTVMTVRRPACLCLVGARALTEDVLAHSMVGRCSCAWRRRSSYTNQSGIGCRSSSLRRTRSTPSSSDASKGEIDGLYHVTDRSRYRQSLRLARAQ